MPDQLAYEHRDRLASVTGSDQPVVPGVHDLFEDVGEGLGNFPTRKLLLDMRQVGDVLGTRDDGDFLEARPPHPHERVVDHRVASDAGSRCSPCTPIARRLREDVD